MKTNLSRVFGRMAKAVPGVAKFGLQLASQAVSMSRNRKPHWFVRQIASELNYRITVDTCLGNGMKIRVVWTDEVGSEIYTQGYYELPTVKTIQKLLKPGMVCVDIGAQVGQYTLLASELVGQSGAVHSFEPDPETHRLLLHNVASNQLTNVHLNSSAVGERCETVSFYAARPDNIGTSSLRKPANFSGSQIQVQCQTLDQYVEQHGIQSIDLIKIDAEGAELQVLRGARSVLSRSPKPHIIIEFVDEIQRAFGSCCAQLAAYLQEAGYTLLRIRDQGPEPYCAEEDERCSVNILAVPPTPLQERNNRPAYDFVEK